MLRLKVEGPAKQVKVFLRDFASLPQHEVKVVSDQYQNDDLQHDEIGLSCNFVHYPLSEINQPINVTFTTRDGKDLSCTLLQGSVIRIKDVISLSGKITKQIK